MLKDFLFLLIIALLGFISFRVFFKPILNYLNKKRIENFQSQMAFDASPRTLDSQEYQFGHEYGKGYSERAPDVTFERIHILGPNVAQYGKSAPTFIRSSGGIPDAALPTINLRDPWSTDEIAAAELPEPESTLCEKSATGAFVTCGVKTLSSACDFDI